MAFTLGIVGAGQFAGQFATLFHHHPGVSAVHITDVIPARADELVRAAGLAGTFASFEEMIASPAIDAVAIFTQRWTHGPLVVRALRAGKHVYSAVPMAISVDEIAAIIEAVRETGLTYMMGETSYYNPSTVFARQKLADAMEALVAADIPASPLMSIADIAADPHFRERGTLIDVDDEEYGRLTMAAPIRA